MGQQSWGNTARRQDSLRRGGFSSSFRIVEKQVKYENAGFWLRVFAWWWDTLIFGLMQTTVIITFIFGLTTTAVLNIQNLEEMLKSPQTLKNILTGGNISLVLITIGLITVGLYCLYHVSFEVFFNGATPGKWLIGLKVLDADDQPLSIRQSLERNTYKFTSFGIMIFGLILACGLIQSRLIILIPIVIVATTILGLVVGVVGYLMAAFTVQKQALHDQWSYSFVVLDPNCSNVKRVTFSVIAAIMIVLSFILQVNEQRSRHNQIGVMQPNSIISLTQRSFR
jgi:uncharacterized RDD family membrane protein YckC